MPRFFSPSSFEAPYTAHNKFEFFGMGEDHARALGRKLSLSLPDDWIVIVGTAGALNPNLKTGDCFVLRQIRTATENIDLVIPHEINFLKQASVTSVTAPLVSEATKLTAFQETKADLVDCETFYLFDELHPKLRSKTIFIRGVIDSQDTKLPFLKGFEMDWGSVVKPQNWLYFARFVFSYFRYRSQMNTFFQRLVHALGIDEVTKTENRGG